MSFSSFVDQTGEKLARTVDRRKFLKRMCVSIFSLTTGAVLTFVLDKSSIADASGYCPYGNIDQSCGCQPSYGIYCTQLNSNYCSGHTCSGGCSHDTNWGGSGCWCTLECTGGSCGYTVYYICCDCHCAGQGCTCAEGYIVNYDRNNPDC